MEKMQDNLFEFAAFDEKESEHIAAPRYSYWKSVWRTFVRSWVTIPLTIFVIALVVFSLVQPLQSGYTPTVAPNINNQEMKYLAPSGEHIFGTDNIGNEVWDVVWAGARNSIIVSFVSAAVILVIGILVGAVWGFSKKMDKWMIEVYNIFANVPYLLLVMVLSYVLGPGLGTLIIVFSCIDWLFLAYFIRTQVMIIRDREYNMASKCLGTKTITMILKNILPYLVSVIVTYIARLIPSLISYEVFLSYLGLGLGSNYASLGRTISQYVTFMQGYPHLFWIPVLTLAVLSMSLYVVGQKLADATDPRTHR